jgi:transcription termination factor Rho
MTEDTENHPPAAGQAVAEPTEKSQRPRRGRPPRRRSSERKAAEPKSAEAAEAPANEGTPESPALISAEIAPTAEPVSHENATVAQNVPADVDAPHPGAAQPTTPETPAAEAPRQERAPEAPRQAPQPPPPPVFAEGIVEVSGKGFGFLREPKRNFTQSNNDVFVTPEVIRKHNLRDGMWIRGETRRGPRGPQLFKLTELEHEDPANFSTFPVFEELTTVSPDKRIKLETVPDVYTTRIIDLIAPIGRGQRGLIVAPPRTGKTTLLQHIAGAVAKNYPDIKLIILLVDERPEEVTEIRRTCSTAEVMASSNDSDVKTHTRISQLAIERAKRLVEMGKDVFVLMDSLTRMGRAFNNAQGGGGRTMSGGVDSRALEIPRKLFAAARNTEEAGSLTIMATALIETNSRMDDLIFQEFKGTGNMELVLGRLIAEQRIYPAVDIFQSGTRREELLLPPDDLHKINVIRRGLAGHKPIEAIERLLFFVRKYPTNTEMLKGIPG